MSTPLMCPLKDRKASLNAVGTASHWESCHTYYGPILKAPPKAFRGLP